MAQGYSSTQTGDTSSATPPSVLDKLHDWWDAKWSSANERAPLLDRQKMTLEPPKRGTFKVIFYIVLAVVGIFFLGVVLSFLVDSHPKHPHPHQLTKSEKLLLELPQNTTIREYLKHYTSEAHLAGTDGDKRQAEWTRDKFIEFGITNTTIETYWPLLNYPVSHRFALISGPEEFQYEAELREDPVEQDETSHDPDVVPTFHGYSKNGTATGRVVYANYGRVEDFQFLVDQGIELNGTIALVRYGGAFRGLKVRAAQLFGCVGALIYSDPIDDGPLNKEDYPFVNPPKAYPEGPWRSESSVQRGSVQFLSLTTGDPLTPGYPATKDAERIKRDDSPGLAQIPSLPLSYRDALPLLKAMEGRGVQGEGDWKGGLEGVGYFSGPTEGEAILENIVDEKVTPIWNVIGTIQGAVEPDRVIVLGNHRDAWVYGAVDPSSGSATMIELVRVFGELLKTGWRPARTIVLASWDAEEYGLVGSTEWVEDHREWLAKEAAVYINVDVAVSGPHFAASASPSLKKVLYEVTQLVQDPRTGSTVYEAWSDLTNRTKAPAAEPFVGQLGSGSDFVPFLDHVGIASVSLEFTGDYGVYHSNYDSFHWMESFGDPEFTYHQTLAKIWGLLALRLSDSVILPLYPTDYAASLSEYAERLASYSESAPKLAILQKAIHRLTKLTNKFENRREQLEAKVQAYHESGKSIPSGLAKKVEKANQQLTYFERGLLDPEGLPGRTWFKHVVYAPGLWTGYDSQVFPAIAEAVDEGNLELAQYAEKRAALSIRHAGSILKNNS